MACTLPLVAVNNDNCATLGLGTQIPDVFYQDPAGAWPATMTEAAFQAAMTATGEDKLFVLKNLAAGFTPAATDQTLSGSDLPRGGTQVTNRTRTFTGRLQYIGTATTAAVNAINARGGAVRIGLLDNKDFLQGPIEDATMTFSNLIRAGVGQNLPAHYLVTITYEGLDEADISATPLPFLKTLVNA